MSSVLELLKSQNINKDNGVTNDVCMSVKTQTQMIVLSSFTDAYEYKLRESCFETNKQLEQISSELSPEINRIVMDNKNYFNSKSGDDIALKISNRCIDLINDIKKMQ